MDEMLAKFDNDKFNILISTNSQSEHHIFYFSVLPLPMKINKQI